MFNLRLLICFSFWEHFLRCLLIDTLKTSLRHAALALNAQQKLCSTDFSSTKPNFHHFCAYNQYVRNSVTWMDTKTENKSVYP